MAHPTGFEPPLADANHKNQWFVIQLYGAPNWIRTSGPQIRNLMLYPAELWVR
jgi:hypothetical protein